MEARVFYMDNAVNRKGLPGYCIYIIKQVLVDVIWFI